jgi:hypothetical protein
MMQLLVGQARLRLYGDGLQKSKMMQLRLCLRLLSIAEFTVKIKKINILMRLRLQQ